MIKHINVKSSVRTEFIDITGKVREALQKTGITSGICCLFVPHTTAGITINEGADPSVQRDIQTMLNRLVPFDGDYHHSEGNSEAHIKSTLTGTSQNILIDEGRLVLGRWQSIFFCEFDGPRQRRVGMKIISGG